MASDEIIGEVDPIMSSPLKKSRKDPRKVLIENNPPKCLRKRYQNWGIWKETVFPFNNCFLGNLCQISRGLNWGICSTLGTFGRLLFVISTALKPHSKIKVPISKIMMPTWKKMSAISRNRKVKPAYFDVWCCEFGRVMGDAMSQLASYFFFHHPNPRHVFWYVRR